MLVTTEVQSRGANLSHPSLLLYSTGITRACLCKHSNSELLLVPVLLRQKATLAVRPLLPRDPQTACLLLISLSFLCILCFTLKRCTCGVDVKRRDIYLQQWKICTRENVYIHCSIELEFNELTYTAQISLFTIPINNESHNTLTIAACLILNGCHVFFFFVPVNLYPCRSLITSTLR